MRQAYWLDLRLFVWKVAPHAGAIVAVLLASTVVFELSGAWPGATFLELFVRAFYMMILEAVDATGPWYLGIFVFILPVLGLLFAAQGLVGATVLFINKSQRQGEWSAVVAATYSQHTIVCGLGQLGDTLCDGLREAGNRVVGVDVNEHLPPVVKARQGGIPVIIGDMTVRQTLEEAGIGQARCVVMCSGDDLANIEAAILAKELNSSATVYARVFKKSLADRISEALRFDIVTFSPYSTAAKMILSQMSTDQPVNAAGAKKG